MSHHDITATEGNIRVSSLIGYGCSLGSCSASKLPAVQYKVCIPGRLWTTGRFASILITASTRDITYGHSMHTGKRMHRSNLPPTLQRSKRQKRTISDYVLSKMDGWSIDYWSS